MYYVARLKMNREGTETACWMTQNLDLNLNNSDPALNSSNTDIDSDWTPQNNTISFSGTSLTGWTDSYTNPYSADPGDVYYYTSNSNSSDITYDSLSACVNAGNKTANCRRSHAGNYYNFTAAVAMDDSSSYTTKYQTADQSICPSGWKIPTGMLAVGVAGEINHLLYANNITDILATQTDQNVGYAADGFNNIRTNPLGFSRSGRIYSASLQYPGIYGYYMSSSVFSPAHNYYLNFGSGYLGSTYYNNRAYGYNVRCVLRGNNYTLEFDANGGIDAPATISQEGLEFATFTLPTNDIPEHDTRQFYGWDTSKDATTPYYVYDHTTKTFSQGTVTLTTPNTSRTLYAIWHQPVGMGTVETLQEVTPALCQASPLNQQYRLKDARDDKMYYIARLKMNREGTETACWMTQNLDLDLDSTASPLNSNNTDIDLNWTPKNSTIGFDASATPPTIPGWVNDQSAPYSADPGDIYYYTSNSNSNDITYDSLSACVNAGNKTASCRRSHAGNYYNWTAAVAMDDSSAYVTNYQAIDQSICPSSWRLPIGMTAASSSSEYAKLVHANEITDTLATNASQQLNYTATGFNNFRTSPIFMVRAGYVASGNLIGPTVSGLFWSSSVSSSEYAYYMSAGLDIFGPQYNGYRISGISVRCTLRGNQYTLNFDANGGTDAPAAIVGEETYSPSPSTTFTIPASIPNNGTRTFRGWATSAAAINPDYTYDPNTQTFSPSAITLSAPDYDQTLYAVWSYAFVDAFVAAGKTRHVSNYYKMQDMSPEICNMVTGYTSNSAAPEIPLVDTRDGKVYWVAKLKMNPEGTEHQCWMVQNLDFSLSATSPLSTTDSDVLENWTPPTSTTTTISGYSGSTTNTLSYDGNDYYWNGTWGPSSSSGTGFGSTNFSSYFSTTSSAAGDAGTHYHVGNHYQWNTATAGTGGATVDREAVSSICPKGWRLPDGNNEASRHAFSKLLAAYNVNNNTTTLATKPLYFTPTGALIGNNLDSAGYSGDYWTSRAYSSASSAYFLNFFPSSINPAATIERYSGSSVRCVAHDYYFTLRFDANGGSGAPDILSKESLSTTASLDLPSSIPTHSTKEFRGWATSATATEPDYTYNSNTQTFSPSTIDLSDPNYHQTLYAVWATGFDQAFEAAGKVRHETGYYKMQDMNSSICNAVTGYTVDGDAPSTQLVDTRDGKIYWVSKLKMNSEGTEHACWMTQNLDLEFVFTSTFSPDDTDVDATWYPSQNTSSSIQNVYNSSNYTGGYSYNGGNYYWKGNWKDASPWDGTGYSHINFNNFFSTDIFAAGSAGAHYHIGNQYQWNAATAGTGDTISGQEATSSICPKGWRLPDGNTGTYSFNKLVTAYGITTGSTLAEAPIYFVPTGYLNDSSLYYAGTYGYYWSSRAYSNNQETYNLFFDSESLESSQNKERYRGHNIRCIAY